MDAKELMKDADHLPELVRHPVTVFQGHWPRNEFAPGISICGKLEKHPNKEQYRVMLGEGLYTYFDKENVLTIVVRPEGYQSLDGTAAVIFVSIPAQSPKGS